MACGSKTALLYSEPLRQTKVASSQKIPGLSQLEEPELSQAQHQMEVVRDRKYDKKNHLIQHHIKHPEDKDAVRNACLVLSALFLF